MCRDICGKLNGNYIDNRCTGENNVYCRCRLEIKEYIITEKEDVEYKKEESIDIIDNIVEIFETNPERKEQCMEAFDYLNSLRTSNGKHELKWDDRLYNLVVSRSKDMYDRNYFDHVTPEGKCAKDLKSEFGIASDEILAENAGGMSYYSKGVVAGNCKEAVDSWMSSRGHRYNLLYDEHTKGAIGCYYEICIFFGLHTNLYGLGAGPCTTGEEGLAFWETATKQEGEV